MTIPGVVNILELLVAIAFLAWFFYGPWNRFVVDLARQNLFEIRDEIFLMAADHALDFDSKTYQGVRGRLNRMIKYCHHLTLFSVVFAATIKTPDAEPSEDAVSLIRSLPDKEIAANVERRYYQAIFIMLTAMIFRSALLTLIFLSLLPFAAISELLRGSAERGKRFRAVRNAIERDILIESSARPA